MGNIREEIFESLIKCNPNKYKVYRDNSGKLLEVYDKYNKILWAKKYIYIGSNNKRRTLCWLSLANG